jgi:hypothetical protein
MYLSALSTSNGPTYGLTEAADGEGKTEPNTSLENEPEVGGCYSSKGQNKDGGSRQRWDVKPEVVAFVCLQLCHFKELETSARWIR